MDNWSLKEWRSDTTAETRIFRKNLDPAVKPGSSSHSFVCYLTFGYTPKDESGLPNSEDADRLVGIEEKELPALEAHNLSVLVGVVLAGGVKDFIYYTSAENTFLEAASRIRDAHPEFKLGCEVGPDKEWSHYAQLP
jgi:hypothetical protein